ncbi:hypothetical protein [Nocardia veterana]|uniref:Uncharacterized protein n=1 Tax=Nocardia veterana TaxID=132249 RepID=A0A7X6RL25_9NOCA|nr:hypothetical protein [Nocardia veterana]NKY89886.1 hypothetical protein [Nocardia veterana]
MNDTACAPAIVAAALHSLFAASTHAPDSLELWLAITAEATSQLTTPDTAPSWLPVFTVYRSQRTDARYHPATTALEITSGPLTGTSYADPASAADAVATAYFDCGHHFGEPPTRLPTWRLCPNTAPPPRA